MSILTWEPPPRAKDPQERAQYWGGGIPGAYAPNMDEAWMGRWKAKMVGARTDEPRVEIRKSFGSRHAGSVQAKIVVMADESMLMSMNGTASLTAQDFAELYLAVGEARIAIRERLAGKEGEASCKTPCG